jgi:hypothetical protein
MHSTCSEAAIFAAPLPLFSCITPNFMNTNRTIRKKLARRTGRPPGAIPALVVNTPIVGQAQRGRWLKVERARSYLEGKTQLAAKMLIKAMKVQAARGDTDAARWLLEHAATVDPQGREVRPVAIGVDRPAALPAAQAPRVQIAIGLGADFARVCGTQLNAAPTVQALPASTENEGQ